MPGLTLVIGNKNYSSWSMRPWVLLREFGIAFEEVRLPFHSSEWDESILRWSPSRLVPVLWRGEQAVWDSLAIVEAVNEWHADRGIWPEDPVARAFARCASAEMHSGFRNLRTHMPMNIRASHPGKGMNREVQADLARIEALWAEARRRFGTGGEFLCGRFSAADAMFAPVVMRMRTYAPALTAQSQRYCEAVLSCRGVRDWMAGALAETEFVAEDEPYAAPAARP